MIMELPEFKALFIERATAPFFVFQVFCVGLWCLDEYWYYSLFTLAMLVMFECTLVKQQLRNMTEIRNMGNSTRMILCYRLGKWIQLKTDELLPGNIVSMASNTAQKKRDERDEEDILSPCDLLLLSGRLVCDEALLTGESIPQVKEGIDMLDQTHILNLKEHQVAVISGGTKIMQHIPSSEVPNVPGPLRPTDKGCPAIVMRTAFSTTQGSLLRTILFGSKRVTANNAETGCFILILLAFAIAAASHLWVEGH
jgi:cation-transporting ATPase 13A1